MNNAFSSNFFETYDRLLYFWGINGLPRDCSQNQVYLISIGHVGCSSEVGHSTSDREVGGSIPLAPFFTIVGYLSKDFRYLKDKFSSSSLF